MTSSHTLDQAIDTVPLVAGRSRMSSSQGLWGRRMRFITVCDSRYLPGAYALANSVFDNKFGGRLDIYLTDPAAMDAAVSVPNVDYFNLPRVDEEYHQFINRLEALVSLPPGNYCYLDSDVVFERPCGAIFSSIDDGILVSAESARHYAPCDVWLREACLRAGVGAGLPDFPYISAGLLGFQMPRDADFLRRLLSISRKLFRRVSPMEDTYFPHLDQDVLNLLVRERLREGGHVFTISPRRMETGNACRINWHRRFPHRLQGGLLPRDQMKYVIHGASLRRPWIDASRGGPRGLLESSGIFPMRRRLLGTLTPYERAWAHFACSGGQHLPVETWASTHRFTAYQHPLWRKAFDL